MKTTGAYGHTKEPLTAPIFSKGCKRRQHTHIINMHLYIQKWARNSEHLAVTLNLKHELPNKQWDTVSYSRQHWERELLQSLQRAQEHNAPSQRTAHSNVPATNAQVPNAGNQQRTSVEVMHGWLGCVDSLDPPPNPPHWVRHTTGSRELPQGPAMAFAHNTGNTQTPLGEEPNAIAPALGVLSEENNTYIQNG